MATRGMQPGGETRGMQPRGMQPGGATRRMQPGRATLGIVCNDCYGGFSITKEGEILLLKKGMPQERIDAIRFSNDPRDRMDPLLVASVREHPESFKGSCTYLYVEEIPVHAIKADAVSIDYYDGNERAVINWEKVALWKKSNERSKKFAALEAAIIGEASKDEVMRLLEEFKKTIPEPMPSKPVPDELP